MANAESGLEELARRLTDALGAAQILPSGPTAALAELVARQEPGDRSQATGISGSAAGPLEQFLAGGGTAGGASEGRGDTGHPPAAQVEQLLAGSGAGAGAQSEGSNSTGDSATAQVEQLLAGSAGETSASTADTAAMLAAAVEQLRTVAQVQTGAASQNGGAISGSSQSNSGGNSALDSIGSVAASVFENGLGLGPLIGGLASLFGGGGGSTTPPPLSTYTAPESVQFEGDVYRSANATDWGKSGGAQTGAPLPTNTQITVQVNAMDSQSFLDHSQDIANAVRQAMLNSNSLNDVVNEL